MTKPHDTSPLLRRALQLGLFALVAVALPLGLHAADAAKRAFDIPAGDAGKTLKQFALQANREIMFPDQPVDGVKTHAVHGDLTVGDALDRLLAGTTLKAIEDEKTGALMIKRDSDPNVPRAAQSASRSDRPATSPIEPAKPSSGKEEAVMLDPFEVKTEKDTSYGALNSNSITRFNTELAKTPVVADIFTEQFIQDTAVTTLEDLFGGYASGAGQVLATPESDSTATQPGDRFSVSQLGARGLSAGTPRRDGFQFTSTQTNATNIFDTERVEVIHGSQGLLYGAAGAGGLVNIVAKQAKFDRTNGRFDYRVDQYGSKRFNLDFNEGAKWVAARVDILQQNNNDRNLYVGDNTQGYYGALAFRLPFHTTLRVAAEGTHNERLFSNTTTVNFGTTASDPRSGRNLLNLLLANSLGANDPVTGAPFAGGAIDNGHVTDRNAKSWGGGQAGETQDNTLQQITLDSVWTKWLSTSFGVLYNKSQEMRNTSGYTLIPPSSFKYASGTNPNPFNEWATSTAFTNSESPNRKKEYRAAVLVTNDLFNGKAHSQTSVGFDRSYDDSSGGIAYQYYLANPDGSVTLDLTKSNLGRTQIPTEYWAVGNGPIEYPYAKLGASQIRAPDANGVMQLWTRQVTNPRNPAWITPNNPLGLASLYEASLSSTGTNTNGVSGGNNGGFANQSKNQGAYLANYTSWFDDAVQTMFGARRSDAFTRSPLNATGLTSAAYKETRQSNFPSYNAGFVFRVPRVSWLRGYVSYSRTFNTTVGSNDPYGDIPLNPTGYTYEGGLKFASADNRISGSFSGYTGFSKNDNYNAGTTFRDAVNPAGLNGAFNSALKNQWAQFDKTSKGVEIILTAAPTHNWRMRFAANAQQGTVLTDSQYPLLYNDQFFTDGKGNVTYGSATGQAFLVPTDPTTLTKIASLTSGNVNPATTYPTATFVPLTLAMINNPASPYFAFGQGTLPQNEPINGSIGNPIAATAQGTQYLKNVLGHFVNASGQNALTGVTGLPISAMQYDFADPGHLQGVYVVQKKGNKAVGAPAIRLNLSNDYAFSGEMLKGFHIGGTVSAAYYNQSFYYANPDRSRHLFAAPVNNPQVNGRLSYERKIGKVRWSTQVNIDNMFNRYVLVLNPNNGTGFTNPTSLAATFYGVPRSYVWTNSLDF